MSGNPSMIRHGYCLCLGLSARWDHQQTSDESTMVVLFHPCCPDINAQKSPDRVHLLCVLISQLPLFLLSSEYNADSRAINNSQRKLIFSQLQVTSQLGEVCLTQIPYWNGGLEHQLDFVGTKPAWFKSAAGPQSWESQLRQHSNWGSAYSGQISYKCETVAGGSQKQHHRKTP